MEERRSSLVSWIWAQAIEVLAILALIPLRLGTCFLKEGPRGAGRKQRPILLIHGYCNSGCVWIYQRKQLEKKGFGPIYTLNLGYPFHSIRSHAKKVAQKAEQIERETGRSDLTLIGHSMGGLVSADYALHLAPPDKVYQVIAIGAPLQGTHIAKIGLGACAREMEIGSPFIRSLQEAMDLRADIRFYTIGTRNDQLVVPYASCHPAAAVESRLLDRVGHAALLFSPRVADQIGAWVEKGVL